MRARGDDKVKESTIQQAILRWLLFPAHAGVIPFRLPALGGQAAVPRTRGGDPTLGIICQGKRDCSPHTRG